MTSSTHPGLDNILTSFDDHGDVNTRSNSDSVVVTLKTRKLRQQRTGIQLQSIQCKPHHEGLWVQLTAYPELAEKDSEYFTIPAEELPMASTGCPYVVTYMPLEGYLNKPNSEFIENYAPPSLYSAIHQTTNLTRFVFHGDHTKDIVQERFKGISGRCPSLKGFGFSFIDLIFWKYQRQAYTPPKYSEKPLSLPNIRTNSCAQSALKRFTIHANDTAFTTLAEKSCLQTFLRRHVTLEPFYIDAQLEKDECAVELLPNPHNNEADVIDMTESLHPNLRGLKTPSHVLKDSSTFPLLFHRLEYLSVDGLPSVIAKGGLWIILDGEAKDKFKMVNIMETLDNLKACEVYLDKEFGANIENLRNLERLDCLREQS
ncbi:hypothetical protein M422DRAFT_44700 [Sphaerobolus stellatus SS14]|nr:hypothetical protein M422DRAFT_44700 [Sphaerobolus stellatus SS14]